MGEAQTVRTTGGRERLLKAALRLSAKHRSIASLGLRELAREAGLHHTAIYRHFSSIEAVALDLVGTLSAQLRADLHAARRSATTDAKDMIRVSTERYFAYVGQHPQGVIFCAREIHGALPALREALQNMLDDFARDSAADLDLLDARFTLPDSEKLHALTRMIAHHNLFAALDYLEWPDKRSEIIGRTVLFTEWLLTGATAPAANLGDGLPGKRVR